MVEKQFSSPDQCVHGEYFLSEMSVHLRALIKTRFLYSEKKRKNGTRTWTTDEVKHFMDFLVCSILDSFQNFDRDHTSV